VEQVGTQEYILELFRGPTASFKDLSSRLLPCFIQHAASSIDDSSRYCELLSYTDVTSVCCYAPDFHREGAL